MCVPCILVSLEWMQGCWCLNPYDFVFYRWYICCNGFCSDWRIFKVGRQDKTNTNAWPPNVWNKYFASPQPLHPHDRTHIYTQVNTAVCVSVSRQATAMAIICSPPNPIQCQCPELRAVSHPAQQQIPDPKTIAVAVAHCPLIFSSVLYPSDHREGKVIQTHECLLSSSSSSSWGLVFLSIVAIVVGASTFC